VPHEVPEKACEDMVTSRIHFLRLQNFERELMLAKSGIDDQAERPAAENLFDSDLQRLKLDRLDTSWVSIQIKQNFAWNRTCSLT
jgi:hypothetical protein